MSEVIVNVQVKVSRELHEKAQLKMIKNRGKGRKDSFQSIGLKAYEDYVKGKKKKGNKEKRRKKDKKNK